MKWTHSHIFAYQNEDWQLNICCIFFSLKRNDIISLNSKRIVAWDYLHYMQINSKLTSLHRILYILFLIQVAYLLLNAHRDISSNKPICINLSNYTQITLTIDETQAKNALVLAISLTRIGNYWTSQSIDVLITWKRRTNNIKRSAIKVLSSMKLDEEKKNRFHLRSGACY